MLHPDQLQDLCEPDGYAEWSIQDAITEAVQRIRAEHQWSQRGIRVSNMTESERLRDYFAVLLRPYGLRVSRMPKLQGRVQVCGSSKRIDHSIVFGPVGLNRSVVLRADDAPP